MSNTFHNMYLKWEKSENSRTLELNSVYLIGSTPWKITKQMIGTTFKVSVLGIWPKPLADIINT